MAVPAHWNRHTFTALFFVLSGEEEVDLGGQRKVFGDVRDLESVSRLLCRLKHQEGHQKNYLRNVWCNGKVHFYCMLLNPQIGGPLWLPAGDHRRFPEGVPKEGS